VLLLAGGLLLYIWGQWVVPRQFRRAQARTSSDSRAEFERAVRYRWMIRALAVVKLSGMIAACLGTIGVATG
jgi:hypothetical protein